LPRRTIFAGGMAVIVKSRIRKPSVLSWDTWWNDGLRLLGERLGISMPSNATAEQMARWRDEIGQALIEEQPEFRLKGPGRPPGSRTKNLPRAASTDTERKRRQRQRQQAEAPQVVLQPVRIGDHVVLLSEQVIAGLKDFLIGRDTK
jgi:hypothetical protein